MATKVVVRDPAAGILSRPPETTFNLNNFFIFGTHRNLRIGTERYWHKMYDYLVCFSLTIISRKSRAIS